MLLYIKINIYMSAYIYLNGLSFTETRSITKIGYFLQGDCF